MAQPPPRPGQMAAARPGDALTKALGAGRKPALPEDPDKNRISEVLARDVEDDPAAAEAVRDIRYVFLPISPPSGRSRSSRRSPPGLADGVGSARSDAEGEEGRFLSAEGALDKGDLLWQNADRAKRQEQERALVRNEQTAFARLRAQAGAAAEVAPPPAMPARPKPAAKRRKLPLVAVIKRKKAEAEAEGKAEAESAEAEGKGEEEEVAPGAGGGLLGLGDYGSDSE